MKEKYIKIDGITCDHCRNIIKKTLLKNKDIIEVSFIKNTAHIKYKSELDIDGIINEINQLGYFTKKEYISDKLKNNYINLLTIGLIIIIFFLINRLFNINIFNLIPVVNSDTTYVMLFVTGIITSFHCISMCGAINILASSSNKNHFKKSMLYNLGRLSSYSLIGGLVGLLGNIVEINYFIQGIIIIIAAIIMIIVSLNLMNIIKFKKPKIFNKYHGNNSYIIGFLNGFMPCGPMQSIQLFALATGSFIYGALAMFIFCLGTIPLVLIFGVISNVLNNKYRKLLNNISTVLILTLSIAMINRGLLIIGVSPTNIFSNNTNDYLNSKIVNNYQVVEFNLETNGYKDFIIIKDIPVKLIIDVTKKELTGCNNTIIINEYNINKELKVGQNIIEWTPTKTGIFSYTCWMGMLKNNIKVVNKENGESK